MESHQHQNTSQSLKKWIQQWLFILPGVFLAVAAVDGLQAEDWVATTIVALVLASLNVVLRPLLILFALPFVLMTLGLGIVVINSLLLYLAGSLVPGFSVASFGSAFFGSLIISAVSLFVGIILGKPKARVNVRVNRGRGPSQTPPKRERLSEDVIDV